MKKYLIFLALTMLSGPANALSSGIIGGGEIKPIQCTESSYKVCAIGMGTTYHSNCNVTACTSCMDRILYPFDNNYGVKVTKTREYRTTCPSYSNGLATCECVKKYSYECTSGYYGTAISESAGCTKCPSNATCAGGNRSTFVCAKGYYKNGSACTACPSLNGVAGTTTSTGATSITSCYIRSGSSFSDVSGSWRYSDNCYYVN